MSSVPSVQKNTCGEQRHGVVFSDDSSNGLHKDNLMDMASLMHNVERLGHSVIKYSAVNTST